MNNHPNEDIEEEREELYEHYKFVADKGQEITRIDKFLVDRLPNTSRNKIQIAARNGNIRVSNRIVKQNYKVKPGDSVSMVLPYPIKEFKLIAENLPLDIIYEDDQVIVVNKTANMVVHPGYGNYKGTLVNGLIYHFENLPELSDNYYGRPGLVHRIDKHTTGLLVIAKTEEALTDLAKQFYDRTIEREYLALVWGNLENDGFVEGNIGRSLKNRKVMTVFPDSKNGKYAKTHYRIEENYGFATLISCKLETGRTHQIRVHLKHLGHPLFNDQEYGGNKILKGPSTSNFRRFIENTMEIIPGQALHEKKLGFYHPENKKHLVFEVEPPAGFLQIIKKFKSIII